jgi:hypothetical protein
MDVLIIGLLLGGTYALMAMACNSSTVVNRGLLVDRIVAECRLILSEAQAPQPTPEVHDGALNGLPLVIVRPSRRGQCSSRAA